jgi:hypothetical protein
MKIKDTEMEAEYEGKSFRICCRWSLTLDYVSQVSYVPLFGTQCKDPSA